MHTETCARMCGQRKVLLFTCGVTLCDAPADYAVNECGPRQATVLSVGVWVCLNQLYSDIPQNKPLQKQ